jgi:hypothetical protein
MLAAIVAVDWQYETYLGTPHLLVRTDYDDVSGDAMTLRNIPVLLVRRW